MVQQVYAAPASLTKNYPTKDKKKAKIKPAAKTNPASKQQKTGTLQKPANKVPASVQSKTKGLISPASKTISKPREPKEPRSVAETRRIVTKPVIFIDPGHGGKDPGAIGKAGTYEKNVTLNYSIALANELKKSGKYKVVLSRSKDVFLALNERVARARKARADIFISIHADSTKNSLTRGFSVYTLSSNRAERVANKLLSVANTSDEVVGIRMKGQKKDVQSALIDMAQADTLNTSNSFSSIVARKLGQKVKPLEKTRREASLQVLTSADVPSILLELGYLSNPLEEKLLVQKDHRQKIVNGIKSAIDEYFHN